VYEGIPIPEAVSNQYKIDDDDDNRNLKSLSALLSETSPEDECCGAEAAFSEDEDETPNISELQLSAESNRERMVSECSAVSNDDHCDLVKSPTFPGEKRSNSDSYHFYQAEDGQNIFQNIFLHSINARTLIEEYGMLDDGPLKVEGQIIDYDYYTMTKELRKRFRYLSHLPLSTEFMICELILKPPLLSKRTIHNFMPEFKKRKELRLKKFKEQQKFDRQASAIVNKKYGFYVDPEYDDEAFGIDLANVEDFPSNLSHDSPQDEAKVESPEPVLLDQGSSIPSFAQMLSTASAIQQPVKRREVNYTRNLSSYESPPTVKSPTANDDDDGPDVSRPDFKQTFSAAMFAAPLANEKTVSIKANGKKKKDKGTLLFGTGGQRKY